jgi:monofunctional biosynthetic peptidoglycan transglycosylase
MEVYLNSIEMGMVYTGAQAASEHWYRKEAANLTQFKQLELRLFCQTPENILLRVLFLYQ